MSKQKIIDKPMVPVLSHPIHPRLSPIMAPLSSCHISGVFSLSDGSRDTDLAAYAQYLAAIEFHDDNRYINVSIRMFTPSMEALYADNSLVFLVAKVVFLPRDEGMLDSIYCTPFRPLKGLNQGLPLEPTQIAFVTGVVSDVSNATSHEATRSFTLTTSEYVRDVRHAFEVWYVSLLTLNFCFISASHRLYLSFEYDGASNRWKNVHRPGVGSVVTATSSFYNISGGGDGIPVLRLLDISYGGTGEATTSSPTRTIGHRNGQK